MSTFSQKAFNLARLLQDEFKVRFAADASLSISSLVFDSTGAPVLSLGNGTAGSKNAVIRIKQIQDATVQTSLGLVNSVGLVQDNWGPHVTQVAIEANNAAGAAADVMEFDSLLPIVGRVCLNGTRVEVWKSANGTAPTAATFATAANLKGSFDNLQYPLMATM